MPVLSIIIPAYNEGSSIHLILNRVKAVKLINEIKMEVIIVNDCSKDDTEEAIFRFKNENPELPIQYFKHEVNKGKGAAIHTGIKEATGDYIIIQDADLEYDPEEFNDLLRPMLHAGADVVYGSRFIGGNPHRILFFWHTIGNRLLTFLSNMFSNLNLTDMETCYKLFKADIIKNIPLEENRFGFEPEVTQKLARIPGIRIYEVGISYYGRTYDEGKKISWKDGFRALYCIAKYGIRKGDWFKKKKSSIVLMIILLGLVFIRLNFYIGHELRPEGYKWIFWSDALGYYEYLPSLFAGGDIWHQSYSDLLPDGTLFNKYTSGVAYLQMPFFFLAHAYCKIMGLPATGYTNDYGFAMLLAAIVYCFLGLLLTYSFLVKLVPKNIAFLTVVVLYFATNLYYYTVGESGMSHVFSFFVIAWFIWKVPHFLARPSYRNTLIIGLPLALLVLIRPTNILIGFFLILYNVSSWSDFRKRMLFILSKADRFLLMAFIALVIFAPQMYYWHGTVGKWIVNPYSISHQEFIYWNSPKIFQVLANSGNGWLVYHPVMVLSLLGIVFYWRAKSFNLPAIALIFLSALYVGSSWWCYGLDCSFGYRGFVDYYALLAIPLAASIDRMKLLRSWQKGIPFVVVLALLVFINIRMTAIYKVIPCWHVKEWRWSNYGKVLEKAFYILPEDQSFRE
jgi:glycosyltransferase involved in cell wall biosynthesis